MRIPAPHSCGCRGQPRCHCRSHATCGTWIRWATHPYQRRRRQRLPTATHVPLLRQAWCPPPTWVCHTTCCRPGRAHHSRHCTRSDGGRSTGNTSRRRAQCVRDMAGQHRAGPSTLRGPRKSDSSSRVAHTRAWLEVGETKAHVTGIGLTRHKEECTEAANLSRFSVCHANHVICSNSATM